MFSEKIKVLNEAADIYHSAIHHPLCKQSLDYLYNRGVTDEDIEEWNLGACLPSPDFLTRVMEKRGLNLDLAEEQHILYRKEEGGPLLDRMFIRVTIPIYNSHGKIVSIMGRAMSDDVFPKVLYLPNSNLFSRNGELYGLHKSIESISRAGFAVISEGQFDIVSAHRVGLHNCVATCGVKISFDQIQLLKRWTDKVIITLDADRAGRENAEKDRQLLADAGIKSAIASLPDKMDLDDFCRAYGRDGVKEVISKARKEIC